ncbi:NAD-dependent epimerase/dehydratase family protein [Methylomonas sp. EFPC1]|uniref:NAD-dependent epimerase/dehydratase family protein n=1 Tax=Methylomonas sp. EFPC1 TaxID=2812647 RepID=UPI0019680876|nr:NAD-dependent epimerase/dehydratase family protein [Methylomonas sp. EFPC1]QSB01845.1 NAD-dependent epimerase/dehydratase family protein [Methylomonas sp. EFPC1]
MAKQILVTGGLGFIGYHLCNRLLVLEPASEITVVDNISSTKLNYSDLLGHLKLHIQDVESLPDDLGQFDEIYHLASPVGSLGILGKSGRIAGSILGLAEKVAKIATYSKARLLYVSSSEVYGKNGQQLESVEQIVPCKRGARMEYALAKLTAEHVLLNLAMEGDFQLKIVRPFNAMGEWQSSNIGFVIPKFFEAALAGRDLQVFGNGQQIRSFCHVSDLVDGIIQVQAKGKINNIYNLGHPDNVIPIDKLAGLIKELCASNSEIRYVDPVSLYGKHYIEAFDKIPIITKAIDDTGWRPNINLQAGLTRILNHYLKIAELQIRRPIEDNTPQDVNA